MVGLGLVVAEYYDAVAGSLSLRSIAWKVGQVSGPVAVGTIWDATNVFGAFWTAAAVLLVASGVFALLFELDPAPDPAPGPSPGD